MELVFLFLFLHVIILLFPLSMSSNNFECSFVLNFHICEIISYCWEGDLGKLFIIHPVWPEATWITFIILYIHNPL